MPVTHNNHSYRDIIPVQPESGPRTLYEGQCKWCGLVLRTRRSGKRGGIRYEYWLDAKKIAESGQAQVEAPRCDDVMGGKTDG